MKKKYLFIIIIYLFAIISASAQPVITYSGNAPQTGDNYYMSGVPYGGSFDPGPAGGNRIWDFSDVQPVLSSGFAVVDAESTPFAGEFPEADIAYVNIPSDNTYSFQQVTASEMFYVGMGSDPGTSNEYINHFPDARKEMQYPFSYNDVFADTYFFVFPSELMLIHEHGTITATADAWGIVKTPAGNFNNTLRIKKEKVYTDSVWNADGDLMSVTTHSLIDYEWYTAGSHHPVLSIEVTEDGTSSLAYSSQTGGVEDNPLRSQIKIYPNPAGGKINVELPGDITGNPEMEIISLTGKHLVTLKHTGNRQYSADLNGLAQGVHIIRLKTNSGYIINSKFIIK